MYVTTEVKLPIALAASLRSKLDQLRSIHANDVKVIERRVAAAKDPSSLTADMEKLNARGRRLTMPNLLRVVIALGADKVAGAKDTTLLDGIETHGVVPGRPRVGG